MDQGQAAVDAAIIRKTVRVGKASLNCADQRLQPRHLSL